MKNPRRLIGGVVLAAAVMVGAAGCVRPEAPAKVRFTGDPTRAIPPSSVTSTSTTSTTTTTLFYSVPRN